MAKRMAGTIFKLNIYECSRPQRMLKMVRSDAYTHTEDVRHLRTPS